MAGFLHKLENNEAILLLYVADELEAEDRAEVEQMLASDAHLRAELERIEALHGETMTLLEQAEAPVSVAGEEALIRRTLREMRRWQVEAQAKPEEQAEPAPAVRRWPLWGYPLSAAASIVILIGLWGVGVFELPGEPTTSPVVERPVSNEQILAELQRSLGSSATVPFEEADRHMEAIEDMEELAFHFTM